MKRISHPTVRYRAGAALVLLVGTVTVAAGPQSGTSNNAPQRPDQVRALAPGDTDERSIAAGQTVVYTIQLETGQFLDAIVTPSGIDVAAALAGPDGRDLLFTNRLADIDAPERLMAVAETSGLYQIRITSEKSVPAGRYVLSVDAPRLPTRIDILRMGAWRALEEGSHLNQRSDAESLRRAVERLAAALPAFREAGDRAGEAATLLAMAGNLRTTEGVDASDRAAGALALFRELGDRGGTARALREVGQSHARRGEMREAIDLFAQSLALTQATGNRGQEALTRTAMGVVYGRTGDAEQAIDQFRQVLSLWRLTNHPDLAIGTLNNLGIASKDLGDYPMALRYYQEALPQSRARGDRGAEAYLLNNVGNLFRILGEFEKALVSHGEALAVAREIGNLEHEARALDALGAAHYRLGDFRLALDYHQRSLPIRRRLNDLPGEAATLDGAGMAWHGLGADAAAIDNLNEALRIRRGVVERYAEVDTLHHLALVERDGGNLSAALAHIEAAVQLTDSLRGRVVSPDLRASFVAAEHERYEVYVDVLMQLDHEQAGAGFQARALEASERGRARVLLESLLEGHANIRQGVDAGLLGRERDYQRQLDDASARLSRLLSRQSDPAQVGAARTALDSLSTEYRQIQARIRQDSPGYAALTQPRSLTTREIQRELVDADTLLLEFTLGEKRSWLWMVSPTELTSFELPPRREIEKSARDLYRLLTARQPRGNERPTARSTRVAAADADWRKASMALARTLLGPAAARLGEGWRRKRLLIVAAEALEYLPFAALPDPAGGGPALVEDHEIVSLPSASVLAQIRHEGAGRPPAPKRLAVLADPVFEADDPRVAANGPLPPGRELANPGGARESWESASTFIARASRSADAMDQTPLVRMLRLPFTRDEARAIAAFVPAEDRLQATDFQATRALATSGDLGAYRFVHFATHGFLNSEHPELSGLVLSLVGRDGTAQDGFLRLNDVYNLHLSADVVVLSACQTALGKEIRGEGLVGLTRGFMYAGAQRVVASLWQVDDLATAELMGAFYRGMLKEQLRPAAALRAAQRELMKQPRWSSPFFWSAFVLQGDWK